ncbi:MAG: hypothetical protein AB9846_17870 [Tenuifilaceae bacterium]
MKLTIIKQRFLKASSLVEALVALVILIIITTFILLIMNNVNSRSNVGLRTRAFNEVNNIFNLSLKDEDFSERKIDFKNFYITCQTTSSLETEKLAIFKVSAFFSNNRLMFSKQRMVRQESDQKKDSNMKR